MNGRDWSWLLVPAVIFLAWHVPLMYRTAAGLDEDWYGVTGIAILETGLPHVPYIHSDDPRSVCYHADQALYTLPPLFFYLQALVHALLGKSLGPARLTSTLAALAAVGLVHALGRLWFEDRRVAWLGGTVYLFSRPLLFPATMARPDMTAAALGLLSIWCAAISVRGQSRRLLAASGASAGLCLLTHPFGIVPATHVGLWILARPGAIKQRLRDFLVFAAAAAGGFSLWLPLIALHPDLFRIQFGGNVLQRAGAGLGQTLLAPVTAYGFQIHRLWTFLMPPQAVLFLLGLAWSLLGARPTAGGRALRYHLWAGLLLLIWLQGQHSTLGYFAYPAALASLAIGGLASRVAAWTERRFAVRPAAATGLVLAVLLGALLPGAGLRTLGAHLRHWNDPAYDAHALARVIMADLPPGVVTAVDNAYVLDFYLAGRRVVDASIMPVPEIRFYDVRDQAFDYAVFGPMGLRIQRPRMHDLALIKGYGDRHDDAAPYAELYRRIRSNPPRQRGR